MGIHPVMLVLMYLALSIVVGFILVGLVHLAPYLFEYSPNEDLTPDEDCCTIEQDSQGRQIWRTTYQ